MTTCKQCIYDLFFHQVEPFAGIASAVDHSTPRLLLNREIVGPFLRRWERRSNDIVLQGDVVEGVKKLVNLLGWSDSMDTIITTASDKWKDHMSSMSTHLTSASEQLAKSIGKTKEGVQKDKVVTSDYENKKCETDASSKAGCGATANGTTNGSGLSPFGTRTFHSLANGFAGKGMLYRTPKNALFVSREGPMRPNSTARRGPLLPFRYTQRNDLNTQDKSKDFKVIDPSKDLASAGFGLGRRSMGLGCFLAGTAAESSSDDD